LSVSHQQSHSINHLHSTVPIIMLFIYKMSLNCLIIACVFFDVVLTFDDADNDDDSGGGVDDDDDNKDDDDNDDDVV